MMPKLFKLVLSQTLQKIYNTVRVYCTNLHAVERVFRERRSLSVRRSTFLGTIRKIIFQTMWKFSGLIFEVLFSSRVYTLPVFSEGKFQFWLLTLNVKSVLASSPGKHFPVLCGMTPVSVSGNSTAWIQFATLKVANWIHAVHYHHHRRHHHHHCPNNEKS